MKLKIEGIYDREGFRSIQGIPAFPPKAGRRGDDNVKWDSRLPSKGGQARG
jgi:hypothetical protein